MDDLKKEVVQRTVEVQNWLRTNVVEIEDYKTDQELKKPQPPLVKIPMTNNVIELSLNFNDLEIDNDFLHVINSRESHRVYKFVEEEGL